MGKVKVMLRWQWKKEILWENFHFENATERGVKLFCIWMDLFLMQNMFFLIFSEKMMSYEVGEGRYRR